MTERRTLQQRAALVAGAALLVVPAALVALPAYAVLMQGPDDLPEWLWVFGAALVGLCSVVLIHRLARGELANDVLAWAGVAMLFAVLPGMAAGSAWVERDPCYGDCDLGVVYAGLGAIIAVGAVPVGLVLVEACRRARSARAGVRTSAR